jgi:hypothetical protein
MNVLNWFSVYVCCAVVCATITQVAGKGHRPLLEGFLAWLFLPLGVFACISSVLSDGPGGVKMYMREFYLTLLNSSIKEKQRG